MMGYNDKSVYCNEYKKLNCVYNVLFVYGFNSIFLFISF